MSEAGPAASGFPQLTVSKNGEVIKTLPLEGEAVLGRGDACAICLDDRAVSRQHAVFRLVAGNLQVERKSEFAPIWVNGQDKAKRLLTELMRKHQDFGY